MQAEELIARYREEKGKGAAKRLRREGFVPAIFYGHREEPIPLAVRLSDLRRVISSRKGKGGFLTLKIEGMKKRSLKKTVLLKEVQIDPLTDAYLHVDFQGVVMDEEIYVEVPIHLVGKPMGVEKGGVLEHLLREVEIRALPSDIPSSIEVDVSSLDVGDSLHVRDLKVERAKILTDPDQTIATVLAPTVSEEKVEEEEEGAVTEEA